MSSFTKYPLSSNFVFSGVALILMSCQVSDDHESTSQRLSEFNSLDPQVSVKLNRHERAVIYGEDSRLEYYELEAESILQRRAMRSTGLLVRPSKVTVQGQRVLLDNRTLGEAKGLCADELFAEQPEPGFCSGVLIADDLLLTAGHCVDDVGDCENTRVVFRSLYTAPNDLYPTTDQDLYSCEEVLTVRNDNSGDYAVIRLDRSVTGGLEPAPLWYPDEPLAIESQLTLVGGPNGIPIKTDQEGVVTDSGSDARIYFQLSADAFGGNSGSAIYNAAGEVSGILVRGRSDYYFDEQSGCRRVVNVEVDEAGQPTDDRGAETCTYTRPALIALCAAHPDIELCADLQEGTAGEMAGEIAGEMAGDMAGDMAGEMVAPSCADDQEEDDSARQAADVSLDRMLLYNFCDDSTDWVKLDLTEGAQLDFETYSAPFEAGNISVNPVDTVISVYDDMGALMAEDDDGGFGRASRISGWSAPATGEYTARVRSYGSATGDDLIYQFLIRQACVDDEYESLALYLNPADDRSQLQDDQPLNAEQRASILQPIPLSHDHILCDEDWTPIVITAEQLVNRPTLVISTAIDDDPEIRADTIVGLYDAEGVLIDENDDRTRNDRSSYLARQLDVGQEGEYWIRVRAYNQAYSKTRPYTLSVRFDELCDDIDNDLDGLIDEGLTGCLECEPDLYEDNDDFSEAQGFGLGYITSLNHCTDSADYFRFNLNADQSIDVETYISFRSDTLLELYASDQTLVAGNDDRAQGQLASLIEGYVAPLTSTYSLNVGQYSNRSGASYPYRLLVRESCAPDPREHDDSAIEARRVELNSDEALLELNTLCDPDWVRVSLERGEWLEASVRAVDGRDDRALTFNLSRDFGRQLLLSQQSDLDGDLDGSSIIWEALAAGDYWLSVEATSQYYGGDLEYEIELTTRPIERCDGDDNDRDGAIDEEVLNDCGVCGPVPSEECNGEDDDCDGTVDEGVFNSCGVCGPDPVEECNGEDDDCDGAVDEDVLNACGACGPTPTEECNGEDDDCDGSIDEGQLNACGVCGPTPIEECNGEDDDCDGSIDEEVLNACGACGEVPDVDGCEAGDADCDGEVDEDCVRAGEMAGDTAGESVSGDSAGDSSGDSAGDNAGDDVNTAGESAGDDVILIVGGQSEGAGVSVEADMDMNDSENQAGRGPSEGCASASDLHRGPSSLWGMLVILLWVRRKIDTIK